MNHKKCTGAFVLLGKNGYFGIRGFNVEHSLSVIAPTVVVFRRSVPKGRKTPICQSGWHDEIWNRLTKKSAGYRAIGVNL